MSNDSLARLLKTLVQSPEEEQVCEAVHLLFIFGCKPKYEEGQQMLTEHMKTCPDCSTPGSFQGDLGCVITETPELVRFLEQTFGAIE